LQTKVLLTVSPLRPSFPPQPSVFSQRFNFSGQPRGVSHAVSYYCALLNSLAALFATPILYFQQLAHSFVKYGGWGVSLIRSLDLPPRQLLCFLSHLCNPSSFMQLRALSRNGAPLSLVFSTASALFLSPRGWYPLWSQCSDLCALCVAPFPFWLACAQAVGGPRMIAYETC